MNTPLVAEQTLGSWGVGTSGNRCVARQAKCRVGRVGSGSKQNRSSSLSGTGVAPGGESNGATSGF